MTKPRILRLSRPYDTVEEFIANEGWSISTKRMILLDQPELDKDMVVRFEVSLASKEKVIRAEARVIGYQAPENGRPGGPKVRFKRFGGTTKAFIQRVVADHGPVPGLDTMYPSSPAEALASVHPPGDSLSEPDSDPAASSPEASVTDLEPPSLGPDSLRHGSAGTWEAADESGSFPLPLGDANALERLRVLMKARADREVSTPNDRDTLLERLRERARKAATA